MRGRLEVQHVPKRDRWPTFTRTKLELNRKSPPALMLMGGAEKSQAFAFPGPVGASFADFFRVGGGFEGWPSNVGTEPTLQAAAVAVQRRFVGARQSAVDATPAYGLPPLADALALPIKAGVVKFVEDYFAWGVCR